MKKFKIGLQLYSVIGDMKENADETLKAISEMGYECVELAGWSEPDADKLKAMTDKYSLEVISTHGDYKVFAGGNADEAEYLKKIGAKFTALSLFGFQFHKNGGECEYDNVVKAARFLKEKGIQLLYHNHEFEFAKHEGKFLLDWLYEEIPLLQTEIDTCWVRYAGYDPCEYIRKYSGRSPVVHLKDFVCTREIPLRPFEEDGNVSPMETRNQVREAHGFDFRPLGKGCQDIPGIIKACEDAGTEYLVVEMDWSTQMPAMEAARCSIEYLKSLGV